MATRRSRQVPFYGWVCEYCLEVSPWKTQLLTTECSCPVVVPVEVAINDEEVLERIRPLPRSLPSGRFILCKNGDGSCYRGNHCTYAHSKAEQEAWNAQLDTEGVSKIGSPIKVPPSPRKQKVPTQEEFPVLSPVSPFTPTTALSGFSYAQAMRPRRQAPPFRQQIRPQQQQFPPFEVQRQLHNQQNRPVFSNPQHILHQQFGMPRPPPMIPTPHSYYKPPYGHPQVAHPGGQPQRPPLYHYPPPAAISMPTINTAHNVYAPQQQQSEEWPSMSPPSTKHVQPRLRLPPPLPSPVTPHSSSRGGTHLRLPPPLPSPETPQSSSRGGNPDVIHAPLSTKNYKSKFTELLKLEEIEHKKVLEEKCNGEYDLFLYQYGTKPPALRRPPDVQYRRYGYLEDISGDQVAYATQASQGSIYIHNLGQVNICKADILRDNYSHTEEKLYIGFEAQEEQKLQHGFPAAGSRNLTRISVVVKFMLKHSYFRNLKSCVSKAAVHIIQKIVPTPRTFSQEPVDIRIDLKPFESLCSPDQLAALESILTCSPRGPPNIIVGPFGTGKTRILAMAASCFFTEARIKQQPARILVCTQQRESVDNFYDHYQNLMTGKEDDVEVIILRDRGFKHFGTEEKNVYKTIQSFLSYQRCLNVQQNHLVMSTCMMVRELVRDLGDRFFTHILIDEGAQMREPEAIAPLSLANPDTTKIVIAGDQHQVGPAMLVFGEVPSSCGLATSLLERLHFSYKRLRQESYISTLVTNYRSHPDIFELPSSLFYDTPLISPSDRDPPSLHPLYPYPLVFVCSNIDQDITQVDDNVNEAEASILLDEVNKFAKSWPTASWGPVDLSQACIMSPSRPQLTTANQLIFEKRLSGKLKTVRRLPTYDMQGREFRALFLSTSEPTHSDASTCNPTKSLCDRHIFNTALTRAQSLVVAIGNPFLLLKTEQTMMEKYGKKGKVWSNYLKRCLEHGSFFIPPSLNVTKKKAKSIKSKLRALVLERTHEEDSTSDSEAAGMPNEDDFPLLVSPPATTPTNRVHNPPTPSIYENQVEHYPQSAPPSQISQTTQIGHSFQNQQSTAFTQVVPSTPNSAPPMQQSNQDLDEIQRLFPALFGSSTPSQQHSSQAPAQVYKMAASSQLTQPMTTVYSEQLPSTPTVPTVSQYLHGEELHPPASQMDSPRSDCPAQPVQLGSVVPRSDHPSQPVQSVSVVPRSDHPSQPVQSVSVVLRSNHPAQPVSVRSLPAAVPQGHSESKLNQEAAPPQQPPPSHQSYSSVMKTPPMLRSPQANNASSTNENGQNVTSQRKRKQRLYSDTDSEVVAIFNFTPPSSGVWSGGEMRVSPVRELTDGHLNGMETRLDHRGVFAAVGSDSICFTGSISNDTHRRTPTPPPQGDMIEESVSLASDSTSKRAIVATPKDITPECRLDDYEVKNLIGSGGVGVLFHVYRAKEDYALRALRLSDNPKEQEAVLREVKGLVTLQNHPNIVRYHTPWTERANEGCDEKWVWSVLKSNHSIESSGPLPTFLFIPTELCRTDTLHTWLLEHCEERSRKKSQVLDFFKQILEALVYIHGEGFVHRDLNPSNVFFSRGDGRLKLGGFGLATNGLVMPQEGLGTDGAETFLYQSPEQAMEGRGDKESDMFALGVILFEFFYFFKTEKRYKVLTALRSQLEFPSQFTERLPNEVVSIVRLLLATDPTKRPTALEMTTLKTLQSLEKKVRKSKREYIPVF